MEEREEQYKELFELCKKHPNITYHGAVPNEEVREALKQSHIFAYPSIWPETSCLAAIEALDAMNYVVAPNYAALPETMSEWGLMYQYQEDKNAHAKEFLANLYYAVQAVKAENKNLLDHQKVFYDNFYSWNTRKTDWELFLTKTLEEQNV